MTPSRMVAVTACSWLFGVPDGALGPSAPAQLRQGARRQHQHQQGQHGDDAPERLRREAREVVEGGRKHGGDLGLAG